MEELAPIVLFVYNRPSHTLRTLQALEKNDFAKSSYLFVYADGPKENATEADLLRIKETQEIVSGKEWCKKTFFVKREKNFGLADNIVDGVTTVIHQYGKAIVLEDDIVTSRGFLKFMNEALDFYRNEEHVMHISGYMFPISIPLPETFFYNQASCWGWATWARAWSHYNPSAKTLVSLIEEKGAIRSFNIDGGYDFFKHLKDNANGTLKTWAVKWHASIFVHNGLCLHPRKSLVNNIGMDNSGVNSGINSGFETSMIDYISVMPIPLLENAKARRAVGLFYRSLGKRKLSFFRRFISKVKSTLNS